MIDGVDVVAADHLEYLLGLSAVKMFIFAFRGRAPWYKAQIGSDDVLSAVAFDQGWHQFGAYLTARASN